MSKTSTMTVTVGGINNLSRLREQVKLEEAKDKEKQK